MKNAEFQIPKWLANSAEESANFAVRKTVITGTTKISYEVDQSENEMILEILRIGNEIETMRAQKAGGRNVRFWKTTSRTTS